MKYKILNLTLLLLVAVSCKQTDHPQISIDDKSFNEYFYEKKNLPIVEGQILNLSENEKENLVVRYAIVSPLPEQIQIEKSCKVTPNGTFKLQLDHAFPYQQIWITIGNLHTGIYANADLFIELDANVLKKNNRTHFNGAGIKYLGTDGELNTYMCNHVLFERENQAEVIREISKIQRDKKINSSIFESKLDSLFSILNDINSKFIEENPSDYEWIIKNESQSNYYSTICLFHWSKIMSPELFEKVRNHKPLVTSNYGTRFYRYFYSYLRSSIYATGKFRNIDYERFKSYSKLNENQKKILDNYIAIKRSDYKSNLQEFHKYVSLSKEVSTFLHDTVIIERTKRITSLLDSLFEPEKADFLKTKIQYEKNELDKKHQLEFVVNTMQTDWCKQVVLDHNKDVSEKTMVINGIADENESFNKDKLYNQNLTLYPVTTAPYGAEFHTIGHTDAKSFLTYLKNSYSGKALIIDFWATWCAPCVGGLNVCKSLVDQSDELPVEFIFLCTSRNTSEEKWKMQINEIQLAGKHYFVEQDILTDLMKLFSVSGFPSCVFIDKDGNFIKGEIPSIALLNNRKLNELISKTSP